MQAVEGVATDDLSQLTVVKLKELMDERGIEYKSSDNKQELIDKIVGGG